MSNMEIKGALRYDIKASLRSLGIFLLVMILVWLLNFILAIMVSGNGSYSSGFDMAVGIYMFVAGIISVREDLRIFLQNGRGRPTVFLAQIIVALFASAALAVACGLLMSLFQLITIWLAPQLELTSLFGLFGGGGGAHGLAALPETIAFTFFQCLPAFLFGMVISLIYYRLGKLGKVAFSIAVPAVLFVGLPILIGTNPEIAKAFVAFITFVYELLKTPLAMLAAFALVSSPILALCSWLLLRKAPIK
ncbi:MAG: hypothetical protein VB051_03970 [Candidatus Pelethousia sp.]|nr:hypothetical protein [Candidatus Pelethousia sp.]